MKMRTLLITIFLSVAIITVFVNLQTTSSQTNKGLKLSDVKTGKSEKFGFPKAEPVNVWVSADFIQLDKEDMEAIEKELEYSLDPIDGKVILDATEKKELMDAVSKAPSVEFLGSASVLTICGGQSQTQMVEEIRYVGEITNPRAEDEKTDTSESPTLNIETREIGVLLTVTTNISDDGKKIMLVLFPELSFFHGWMPFGGRNPVQPIFSSWNMSTTLFLEDGSTVASKGIPGKKIQRSHVLKPELPTEKSKPKASLMILSVKIVGTSLKDRK